MTLAQSLFSGLRAAGQTVVWLARIMIPVSLVVGILRDTGVLFAMAQWVQPLLALVGLRGEGALVIVTALFMNLYAAIATMSSVGFTMREITILAVMTLISHNLMVETQIAGKTGTTALRMGIVRLCASIVVAVVLNLILPAGVGAPIDPASQSAVTTGAALTTAGTWADVGPWLMRWLTDTARLLGRIAILVTILMIWVRLLEYLGWDRWLASRLAPLMRLFGLPEAVAMTWVVANTLGLSYGAAVLHEAARNGSLTRADGDLLNHHLGVSHSLLEDTLLFVAVGVSAFWLVVPRLAMAMLTVYERRLERYLRSWLDSRARTT